MTMNMNKDIHESLDAALKSSTTLIKKGELMNKEMFEYCKMRVTKDVYFRLLVSDHIGIKELDNLIKILELQKSIIESDAPEVDTHEPTGE